MRTGPLARTLIGTLACTHGLAAVADARQEGVDIAPSREAGAAWRYRLHVQTTLEQEGETSAVEQEARIALRMSDERRRDLTIADARVLEITLRVTRAGETYEVTAERDETGVVLTDAGAPEEIGAIARAIVEAPIRLGLSAGGEVMGLQGLAGAAEAAEQSGALGGVALSVFYPESLAAALEPIFYADNAGDAPRRPGDTWTTTARRPLGEGRTIVETLDCAFDDPAAWTGDLAIAIELADDLPATTSRVEVLDQSGAVTAEWNTEASALERRVRTLVTDLVWRLGDLEVQQRQLTTITLERIDDDSALPDDLFNQPNQAPTRRTLQPEG
ncbi:MAG: hypothetical protein ACF8QF_12420 [Phycisphaerales bacterium]